MQLEQILALEDKLLAAEAAIRESHRRIASGFTAHRDCCETLFLNAASLQRELDVLLASLAERSGQMIRTPMRLLQALNLALMAEPPHRDTLLSNLVPKMQGLIRSHESRLR